MRLRRVAWRGASLLAAGLLGLAPAAAAAAASAASAGRVEGVVPDVPTGAHVHSPAAAAHAAALDYGGGAVLHSNRTHLVFWEPAGSGLTFEPGYETLMERFLAQVATDSHKTTNVYALSGQYSDNEGPAAYASTYGGSAVVTDPLPANQCTEPAGTGPGWTVCLTDAQLQQELDHIVAVERLPNTATDVYFLVLPNGLGTCTDSTSSECALGGSQNGFCGYHSQTVNGVLYAVIPYNAVAGHCQSGNPRPNSSAADPAISTVSHEHNETVTDPITYESWTDPTGEEEADLCITEFGPAIGGSGSTAWNESIDGGHYFLQELWSNASGACEPRAQPDRAAFNAPGRVVAGQQVKLTARASDPEGRIIAYNWWFGTGGTSHRRATAPVFHHPGRYRIVMRATDSWDNWTYAVAYIRVIPAAAREPRRASRR